MQQKEFLSAVANLTEYQWCLDEGRIIGKVRNGRDRHKWFNPVTALARSRRVLNASKGGEHAAVAIRKPETMVAAEALGLSTSIANVVANREPGNRGYAQVLNGRLKRVLLK
jgi:hypothetical protein